MIATVIKTGAGKVFVFDGAGRQLPELQGLYGQVGSRVRRGASPATVFKHWFGTAPEPEVVPAGQW